MRSPSAPASLVALAAVLVVLVQLPGPATCPNWAWRFAGLALESLDADPPEEHAGRPTADADAILPRRPLVPHSSGHSAAVPASAPLHAGSDAIVDSGVTRAPPIA